jgi:predicted O-methyltransferase YrrM
MKLQWLSPLAHYRFWRPYAMALRYLLRNDGPWFAVWAYATSHLANRRLGMAGQPAQQAFKAQVAASLTLSKDWFTFNIPYWEWIFAQCNLTPDRPLSILEIGSWEGLSTYYLLQHFPQASLTAVDTWEGADEHKSGVAATQEVLSQIEQAFDHNLAPYAARLTKYKGLSYQYYLAHPARPEFDLIYVDGSHYCDDVLIDALHSFARLKPGGVMIFDDYLWQHYPNSRHNPASAIHAFLRLKRPEIELLRAYRQLAIRKR